MTTPFNLNSELRVLASPDFSERNLQARIAIMQWMREAPDADIIRAIGQIPTLALCRQLESVGVRRPFRHALMRRCVELEGG